MSGPNATGRPFVRQRETGPHWYAKWSRNGKPVMRALGPAWMEPDGNGGWKAKRGRPPADALTQAQAAEKMLKLVKAHHAEATLIEQDADERRRRGVTFRELANDYMRWLEDVRGAKPSTLRDHRSMLAEPGTPYRRGSGTTQGHIMAALGDRAAREITKREIEHLLTTIQDTGVSARCLNKYRATVVAIYNFGLRKPEDYALAANPAESTDRRHEPAPGPLAFYSVEQVEALARALAAGAHRDPQAQAVGDDELAARAAEDAQDGELVRVAANCGLRRGELIALRWRDVDFTGAKLTVRRALSGDVMTNSTKSGRAREVPLPDQAAAALDRLSRRLDYTGPDEYVFVSRFGRRLDPSALRRRFERARDAAGLPPLRFHDLRHTYGSLLVAAGIDLRSVKTAMGHSRISTTERYLHARPATEQAARFTRALGGSLEPVAADVLLDRVRQPS
ncbi:MAG: tyrosine-type recombinase/integrase [Solirubrobacteraceae bacterium]